MHPVGVEVANANGVARMEPGLRRLSSWAGLQSALSVGLLKRRSHRSVLATHTHYTPSGSKPWSDATTHHGRLTSRFFNATLILPGHNMKHCGLCRADSGIRFNLHDQFPAQRAAHIISRSARAVPATLVPHAHRTYATGAIVPNSSGLGNTWSFPRICRCYRAFGKGIRRGEGADVVPDSPPLHSLCALEHGATSLIP